MDALNILQQAWAAGLSVEADGDRLIIRGPKSAGRLVEALRARKAEVLAEITGCQCPAAPETAERAPTELTNDSVSPAVSPSHLTATEFLGTIVAQHCHPGALAQRLGIPLPEVLRRLEASPWSGHGARHRARLGLGACAGTHGPGDAARPAPPGIDLHFPAP